MDIKAPVSVIIPCYNAGKTIRQAVASVFTQTRLPAEVIIVDDASGPETISVLGSLVVEYPALKVFHLAANSGPSTARNRGWESATQPYLAFLDADDVWHERKLEIQMGWMQGHPDVAMSGHRYGLSKSNPALAMPERFISFSSLLFKNYFSTPGVMLKRSLPQRFPQHLRYAEDYGLWLDILAAGHQAVLLDVVLAFGNKRYLEESGLSANLRGMEEGQRAVYRHLFKEKKINWALLIVVISWSRLRYVRQILLIKFLYAAKNH